MDILPGHCEIIDGRCRFGLRVYYEDTDFSGRVYHASYLRFLERGRTEWLRALGLSQKLLGEERGLSFVVRRMTIDFLRPAEMDDAIVVDTTAAIVKSASMELIQTIARDETALVEAKVLIACVSGGKARRFPARFMEALANERSKVVAARAP